MADNKKTTVTKDDKVSIDMQELKEALKAEILQDIANEKASIAKAVVEKEIKSESFLAKQEVSTLAKLKAEKQVDITIPLSEIGDNSPVTVGINGVVYTIPKGKPFKVPESIYKVWYESYTKTMAANARIVPRKMGDAEIQISG